MISWEHQTLKFHHQLETEIHSIQCYREEIAEAARRRELAEALEEQRRRNARNVRRPRWNPILKTPGFWKRLKVVLLLRIPHPRLLPSNPLSQTRHDRTNAVQAIAGDSQYPSQAQFQPQLSATAPSSPSFSPSAPLPPSTLSPRDPRLPSLYLPSYDEAVKMQSAVNWNSKVGQMMRE